MCSMSHLMQIVMLVVWSLGSTAGDKSQSINKLFFLQCNISPSWSAFHSQIETNWAIQSEHEETSARRKSLMVKKRKKKPQADGDPGGRSSTWTIWGKEGGLFSTSVELSDMWCENIHIDSDACFLIPVVWLQPLCFVITTIYQFTCSLGSPRLHLSRADYRSPSINVVKEKSCNVSTNMHQLKMKD